MGCWLGLKALKTLNFFLLSYKRIEKKLKEFLQRILQEIMKKNDTWNIRHLVDETIVLATQRIILKIVGFHECERKNKFLIK